MDTHTEKLVKQLQRASRAAVKARRCALSVRLLEEALRIAGTPRPRVEA